MKMHLVYLVLLVNLLGSCRRDDTHVLFALPDKTQSGKHTFGFRLNSAVWTNYRQHCTFYGCRENLAGGISRQDGDIFIDADRVLFDDNIRTSSETFSLSLATNFRGVGSYSTISNDTIMAFYSSSDRAGQWQEKEYLLPAVSPEFSIVMTKIDTTQKIMSGEFSGKLFRRISASSFATSPTDSIIITEGRFDIKLK